MFYFELKILDHSIFKIQIGFDKSNKEEVTATIEKAVTKKEEKVISSNNSINQSLPHEILYKGTVRPDLKPKVEKPKKKLVKCPSCGGTTYEDDITECAICKKVVCSGCGTKDNVTGKTFCNDCWRQLQ